MFMYIFTIVVGLGITLRLIVLWGGIPVTIPVTPTPDIVISAQLIMTPMVDYDYDYDGVDISDDTFTDYLPPVILIDEPTIYKKVGGKVTLIELNDPFTCLKVNAYFEAANQPEVGVKIQLETTLNRLRKKPLSEVCEVVKHHRTYKSRMVLNKCHFSWYCDGNNKKVIPEDPKTVAKLLVIDKLTKQAISDWDSGKIKHKLDHYCTLMVEKKTDWIPYMKDGSRYVVYDHVYFESDPVKASNRVNRKLALLSGSNRKGS